MLSIRMFKNILTLSLATGLLVSCSKNDDAKENEQTTVEVTKPAEAVKPVESVKPEEKTKLFVAPEVAVIDPTATVLVIKAAKLSIESGKNNTDGPGSIELDAEGNVHVKGKKVLKLSANGIVMDRSGKTIAKVTADGKLSFASVGQKMKILISEDGVVTVGDKTISTIGDDGVMAAPEMSEKVVFEGPKEARRAMMIVFLAAMMPQSRQPDTVPTVSTVPAAPPAPTPPKAP